MRKTRHSQVRRRPPAMARIAPERKAPAGEAKEAVLMGEPYSPDKVRILIADLQSEETSVAIPATMEFMKNKDAISSTVANTAGISEKDILEPAIAAVLRNFDALMQKLMKERRKRELEFLAKSSAMPIRVRNAASALLDKLPKEKGERGPAPPAASGPSIPMRERGGMTAERVERILGALESAKPSARVPAAIEFLRNYGPVIQAVSAAPMLSVTSAKKMLAAAIGRDPARIVNDMKAMGLRNELELLSQMREMPPGARAMAQRALAVPQAPSARLPPLRSGPAIGGGEKAAGPIPAPPPASRVPALDERLVGQLIAGLSSPEPQKAAASAAECLKRFDEITSFLAKSPAATITTFTANLFRAISSHPEPVIRILKAGRERRALELLSRHPASAPAIRRKATDALRLLFGGGNQ